MALAKVGSDLPFKTIKAGTNITLNSTATEIEIVSAGGVDTNIANADLTFDGDHVTSLASNLWTLNYTSNVRLEFITRSNTPTIDLINNANFTEVSIGATSTGSGGGYLYAYTGIDVGQGNDFIIRRGGGNTSYMKWSEASGTKYTQLGKKIPHYFLARGSDLSTQKFIVGNDTVIGTEDISLQSNTLVKGSDTSSSTTGFKVTNSANTSLLEVKNNGIINASNLPTSSVGLSSGDIWNNGGVLNIV